MTAVYVDDRKNLRDAIQGTWSSSKPNETLKRYISFGRKPGTVLTEVSFNSVPGFHHIVKQHQEVQPLANQ